MSLAKAPNFSLLFFVFFAACRAQLARVKDHKRPFVLNPGTIDYSLLQDLSCNSQYRSYNGSCTNNENPEWGTTGFAQIIDSYFEPYSNVNPTGTNLSSARDISNKVSSQTKDIFNDRNLTELVTFFGQIIDHTSVLTTESDTETMPIPIPTYDPIYNQYPDHELPFNRSVRVDRSGTTGQAPVNSQSSPLDLAVVYGSDEERANTLRTVQGGVLQCLMNVSDGDLLPFNTPGLSNQPDDSDTYYVAGDIRSNDGTVLTTMHVLFLREHNKICGELKAVFPSWTEEQLFQEARKINIAQFQKIVYTEWFPAITGNYLVDYSGFKPDVNPTVSVIFSTAAFRLGHTLVGNGASRRDENDNVLSPIPYEDMFFNATYLLPTYGVEQFIRGAIETLAQEVDVYVEDSLRNFLFEKIPDFPGFDLLALNLQRGRDHALPSYTKLRERYRTPDQNMVTDFSDITSDPDVQAALKSVYPTVDDVDPWIGLMAEDHMPGSSLGATIYEIWKDQFTRWRDGDRFFYQSEGLFSATVLNGYPRIAEIICGQNTDTMKDIIVRNTNITADEITHPVFVKTSGTGQCEAPTTSELNWVKHIHPILEKHIPKLLNKHSELVKSGKQCSSRNAGLGVCKDLHAELSNVASYAFWTKKSRSDAFEALQDLASDMTEHEVKMVKKWLSAREKPRLYDINSLSELINALQIAIQVELATLPPYLTAMFSIKDTNSPSYKLILDIALEEMQHFAMSSNMLVAIAGPSNIPQFNSSSFIPTYPGHLPHGLGGDLVVHTGVATTSQMYAFMQIELPSVYREPFIGDDGNWTVTVDSTLFNETNTIGEFYDEILTGFEVLNSTVPLQYNYQDLQTTELGAIIINNLDDVKTAIDKIVLEGEGGGSPDNPYPGLDPYNDTSKFKELSHFYKFSELYYGKKINARSDGMGFSYNGTVVEIGDTFQFPMDPNITENLIPYSQVYNDTVPFTIAYRDLLTDLYKAYSVNQSYMGDAIEVMFYLPGNATTIMEQDFGPPFELPVDE